MQLPTDPVSVKIPTLGVLISKIVQYVYWAAGIVLLILLIVGGVQLMMSQGNPDKQKMAYGQLISAVSGFLIVFASFAVLKIVEIIFNISIIG